MVVKRKTHATLVVSFCLVAQLVERTAVNRVVAGSIPAETAKLVRSDRGKYASLSKRSQEFESPTNRQTLYLRVR